MNLRSLLLRTALVAVLFGFALAAAALAPRLDSAAHPDSISARPIIFLPLVALPLLHALLAP